MSQPPVFPEPPQSPFSADDADRKMLEDAANQARDAMVAKLAEVQALIEQQFQLQGKRLLAAHGGGRTTVIERPIPIQGTHAISMPYGAELLAVGNRTNIGVLWARVDPAEPVRRRMIQVCGTEQPKATGVYVGTVLLDRDSIVIHVFDLGYQPDDEKPE